MLFSRSTQIFHTLKITRSLCISLVLNGSEEGRKRTVLGTKNLTKKRLKKKVIVKRVSDDIELIWLENLNRENLKLFRKTSYGSFKKINLANLLEKLKEIYPSALGNVNFSPVEASPKENNIQSGYSSFTETKTESKCENVQASLKQDSFQSESSSFIETETESKFENVQASPYLSEYLIKHIKDFPLLKSESDESFNEIFRDENEDFGTVDSTTFPSVTGILNETMPNSSKIKLKQWKDRMIAEMGLEGFNKYQRDRAKKNGNRECPRNFVETSRERKQIIVDMLNQGSKFHSTLKTYLELTDKSLVKVDPHIEGSWKSLEKCLPEITDVRFVEEPIYHPVLMYKGIVDCVANFRGTPCVIEWKKSNKIKPVLSDTYDAPVQLCAYLGALLWHKNLNVESGLVIVAYTNGTPANVFNMSLETCEVYWMEWLERLQTYWQKKTSTVIQQEL